MPEALVSVEQDVDPEREVLLADSVGLAMLVVLDTLAPAERLAFVLHDMFQLPFDEIGRLVDRTPGAARQLASRARRRLQVAEIPTPDRDITVQRAVVDAFFAAARAGDFDALVKVLDPDIVLHSDIRPGQPPTTFRGVADVVKLARAPRHAELHPVLVNGLVGVLVTIKARPFSIMAFTVVGGKIVEIYGMRPDRVRDLAGVLPSTE